jgi:hypothetical protein
MKVSPVVPPRIFVVGFEEKIELKDCARVALDADEQVTFVTESGAEYDVARKSWGFYATPSTNGRLKRFNLRTALIRNRNNQYFVMLVEGGKEPLFEAYLTGQRLTVVCWLDDPEALARLDRMAADEGHARQ